MATEIRPTETGPLSISLPDGVRSALARAAKRRGRTAEQQAAHVLSRRYKTAPKKRPAVARPPVTGDLKTGADALAQWEREGAFLPREGQADSPELARQIRETAWQRQA